MVGPSSTTSVTDPLSGRQRVSLRVKPVPDKHPRARSALRKRPNVFSRGGFQSTSSLRCRWHFQDNFGCRKDWPLLVHMRTTLNIDDKILEKASRLTGVKEKTALVRLGLEALIARESSKRLAKLGGTENNLRSIPRRKSTWWRIWSLLTPQFGLPTFAKAAGSLKSCWWMLKLCAIHSSLASSPVAIWKIGMKSSSGSNDWIWRIPIFYRSKSPDGKRCWFGRRSPFSICSVARRTIVDSR